ncbi:MAG: retention module-containing protein [Deltaproteobacteria bacterium]|nr:retention module-containing protein [Deltaproteobacteria bacterium]
MARIIREMATEQPVVGKVFILYGTVQAVSPDGTVRLLAPNSPIFADDHVITGGDGSVSIQFAGPPVTQLDLGRMTEIVVDQDVYAAATPEAISESTADADQVNQTLLEGDQTIELEATAAGGSTGAGGGHPVVNFTLDGNEGHITSGADSSGIGGGAGAGTSHGAFDTGVPSIPRVDVPVDSTVFTGSGINTTLTVNAGDVITFNWSFDTDDAVLYGNDFGFVVVNGGVAKLADISQVGDDNATGWGTVTFTAVETGPLQIGFGVMNTGDAAGDSHLLIDKLTVNGAVVQGFESGDFAGWSSIGTVAVVPGHDEGGEVPTEGTHMAQITSTSDFYEADLQSFFDLSDGTLSAASATRLGKLAWATADDEGLSQGITGDEVGGQYGHGDLTVGSNAAWNEATFSGTLPHDFGPDGPGGVGFGAMNGQTGMVGTEQVTYSWDDATNTLTATGPRGALFTVEVDPLSGNYWLTLQDNILHSPPVDGQGYENNAYVQQLTYTVTDTDGDHVNGTLNVLINDDMPGADEARATTGAPLTGDLPFGADGAGNVLSIAGTGTANVDTTPDSNSELSVTGKYGGTLTVDSHDGHYLYTAPAVLPKGDVTETFDFKLTDGDGDTASAQLNILIDDPSNNP